MNDWRPLTAAELARAEEKLLHPRPGSKIAAAQAFGIDLTLLLANLRLTPAQRVEKALAAAQSAAQFRGAAVRNRK